MRFLYRYYSKSDFALDTIKNRRLHFSSPKCVGDPFDCRPRFSFYACRNESYEDWKSYLSILAKGESPNISDDEAFKKAEKKIEEGILNDTEWLREQDKELMEAVEESNDIRICCFSKTARSQMMWDKYADEHKGIALQFKTSYLYDVNTSTFRGYDVDYYQGRIKLKQYVESIRKALEGDDITFSRFFNCSKTIDWSGEKEVRFFSFTEYMDYPEEALGGILLGNRCGPHCEDLLYDALRSWRSMPKIFREDTSPTLIKVHFRCVNKSL